MRDALPFAEAARCLAELGHPHRLQIFNLLVKAGEAGRRVGDVQAALAMPWGLGERMQAIKKQIVESGRPDVKVAFTEWLMFSGLETGPHFSNLGGGLFAGGFLNMVMRNSDAVGVSDMTGILDFAGIVKKHGQAYGTPAYWTLRTYSNALPDSLLTIRSDGPTYSVTHGVFRLPEIANVPYLDVVAAQSTSRGTTLLFCVNRHLTRAANAEIDLSALGIRTGIAKISTITADTILAANNEIRPNEVTPFVSSEKFTSRLTHLFSSRSITVIEISPLGTEHRH